MITNSQWEVYLSKYERLMWKISRMISGDVVIANIEDNFSDLSMAAIESIQGFTKKTGRVFDDFINCKLFDGYTKTCLWKHKAKKGAKLTKKRSLRRKMRSFDQSWEIDEDNQTFNLLSNLHDRTSFSGITEFIIKEEVKNLDNAACNIVDLILNNEDVLTNDNRLNCAAISRESNLSLHEINKSLDKLRNKIQ